MSSNYRRSTDSLTRPQGGRSSTEGARQPHAAEGRGTPAAGDAQHRPPLNLQEEQEDALLKQRDEAMRVEQEQPCESCEGHGSHDAGCDIGFYTSCPECGARTAHRGSPVPHRSGCSYLLVRSNVDELPGAVLGDWLLERLRELPEPLRDRLPLPFLQAILGPDAGAEYGVVEQEDAARERETPWGADAEEELIPEGAGTGPWAGAWGRYLRPETLAVDGAAPEAVPPFEPTDAPAPLTFSERLDLALPHLAEPISTLTLQRVRTHVASTIASYEEADQALAFRQVAQLRMECAAWATRIRSRMLELGITLASGHDPLASEPIYDLVRTMRAYRQRVLGSPLADGRGGLLRTDN